MERLRLRLLTVQSQDTIDNIKKVNKLQPTQLPVFLLGQEDFFTELSSTIFQSLRNSVIALKLQLSNVLRMGR